MPFLITDVDSPLENPCLLTETFHNNYIIFHYRTQQYNEIIIVPSPIEYVFLTLKNEIHNNVILIRWNVKQYKFTLSLSCAQATCY